MSKRKQGRGHNWLDGKLEPEVGVTVTADGNMYPN